MRRLARRLFTLCSAVSLLLCVAACVLWVRSYFVSDHVHLIRYTTVDTVETRWQVRVTKGGLVCSRRTYLGVVPAGPSEPGESVRVHYMTQPPIGTADLFLNKRAFRLLGFRWRQRSISDEDGITYVRGTAAAVPFWALCAVSAVLPYWWSRVRRRRQLRMEYGLCPACGEDLYASTERCPECEMTTPERPIRN